MAKGNLNKTEKKQDRNYHSIKSYNLRDHFQQELKSLRSEIPPFGPFKNCSKSHPQSSFFTLRVTFTKRGDFN